MKIVEENQKEEDKENIVVLKGTSDTDKLTIPDVLEAAEKEHFTDMILIGRKPDGNFAISAVCESALMTHFMVRKANFAIEHGILG